MSTPVQEQGKTRYVYDLAAAGAPPAPCSAAVDVQSGSGVLTGTAVGGARASVALLRARRGAGCAVRTAATEQFYFVLDGEFAADINGALLKVPAQHALHVPAGMAYALQATADTSFIVTASRGAAPADGATSGWRDNAAALTLAQTRQSSAGEVRYVYPVDQLEAVPPGVSSATVVPKNYVSGKSSSFGAALSGAALHIGVIHKARGSGAKLHSHPNEQFNVVLKGEMLGEIDGGPMAVTPYGLVHMPAGVHHCTMASADGDITVFVVKDTSHGLSGPPVDGIEDGPRFLPGFGPAAGTSQQ
jgi:quercetin dioxygenase-like cupin family protein